MAGTVRFTGKLQLTNGQLSIGKQFNVTSTLTGMDYSAETITLDTHPTGLFVSSDIAITGWAFFINTDTTNYIEVGIQETPEYGSTFWAFVKLAPRESCTFPITNTHYLAARATTLTARLEYLVMER